MGSEMCIRDSSNVVLVLELARNTDAAQASTDHNYIVILRLEVTQVDRVLCELKTVGK